MDFIVSAFSHWENALAVVLVLGGLIFFHELGHFSVARILGIGVRTFSLGFGPKLLTLRRGKTDYCLSLVPLGGYVALAGEEDSDTPVPPEGKEVDGVLFPPEELFSERPAWHRLLVIVAGPVANFLLALIIYCALAWVQGQTYLLPVVGDVIADSPAAEAGIQPGDTILSIDGKAITTWNEVPESIGAGQGAPVSIVLTRDGQEQRLVLTPKPGKRANAFGEEEQAWLIGIGASTDADHVGSRPLGPLDSLKAGVQHTWEMIVFTCESFAKLIQRVVPLDNVGGPILIAQIVGKTAEVGFAAVMGIAALISVNLGILNLLPIPVLDGGHIVFLLLEMITRRQVSLRARDYATRVGMGLLLLLMLFATWNDLSRLFS